MTELLENFKIEDKFNIKYDENTGLIDINTIDYKIDNKYLKKNPIKFYKKQDIPTLSGGLSAHYQFQINNYYYTFGGTSSGTHGGCHFWPLKENKPGTFNNRLLRYDLVNNTWKDFGSIKKIHKRAEGIGFVYKKKMYILGGYAFEYTDKKYLDEHLEKYGKWPEKKGQWYSDDMWEIYIDKNNNVITKKIIIPLFTNRAINGIVIKNKFYFIGGLLGKNQKNTMDIETLKTYFKNPECKKKINKLGKFFVSGQVLFFIDMENIEKGLQVEDIFPGVPCTNNNLLEHENHIYIFSQTTYKNNSYSNTRPNEKNRTSCTDNWKYNLDTNKWTRIKNNPIKGYHCGTIKKINKNCAIILGGIRSFMYTSIDKLKPEYNSLNYYEKFCKLDVEILKYEKDTNNIYNIDNSEIKPYFKYGTISNTYSYFNEKNQKNVTNINKIKSYDYFQHYFSDLIMYYNFDENRFYLSNYHLPYNICTPNYLLPIIENSVFIIGGESNDILFNNKCHYTNNNLVIKIESDEIKSNI